MKRMLPFLQIAAGTAIAAIVVNLFLMPNELASGGLGGLLLIIHYLTGLPIGPAYFLANLPALFFLYRIYGLKGLARTLWGITCYSVALSAFAPLAAYAPTSNPVLASLYGGVGLGAGLALTIMVGGATGGTDIIAQVVRHYTGMDVSRFLFLTDLAVLTFGAIALSPEAILYGLVVSFICSRVLQTVQEGLNTSRCVMVISEDPTAVTHAILSVVKRGVTTLNGTGGYSGRSRPVLMCVVGQAEVTRVRRLILETDPEAFVFVTDAREVNGRGFTLATADRALPYWR